MAIDITRSCKKRASVRYVERLNFPCEEDRQFFLEVDGRKVAVDALILKTEGTFPYNGGLLVEHKLLGSALEADYNPTNDIYDVPFEQVQEFAKRKHEEVVAAIELAYETTRILPRKIGKLELNVSRNT